MPKLVIEGREKEVEPILRLKLEDNGDGSVSLMGSGSNPKNWWYILKVKDDGTIFLESSVPEELGLQLEKTVVKLATSGY